MPTHPRHHLNPDRSPKPGTYRLIVADPPWSLQQKGKLGASTHYDLMTDEQILGMGEAVREIAAENSFCFLWVTAATLPLGIEVLEAWGFRYVNFFFWAKGKFGLGNTVRNAGEIALLGVRGKGTKVAYRAQPNWSFLATQEHSRKPEEFHLLAERLVGGDGVFLELFARRAAPSAKHWDVWGNELPADEPSLISLAKWGYKVPADDAGNTESPEVEASS